MDNKDVLKKIKNIDGIGIIFVYIAVFTALSIACPNFLKFSNIMVGIRQAVYTAIVGFAMTFVISMGGIDLSVGSTVGIAGMILAVPCGMFFVSLYNYGAFRNITDSLKELTDILKAFMNEK